jgi:imidazolonepropionase-like amidohydrolase
MTQRPPQQQVDGRRHAHSVRPFSRGVRRLLCAAMIGLTIAATMSDTTHAQTARTVGFRQRAFAIVHATVVTRPGEIFKNTDVLIRDGVITGIGQALKIPADTEVIDAKGMYVYAGFIDAGTADPIDANRQPKPVAGRKVDFTRYVLAATRPDNRHSFTPEFHAADALKNDAATPESFRKYGFTSFHTLPTGKVASGQGTLTDSSGRPLRESLLLENTFAEFRLFAPPGGFYPATLMGATAHLRQALLDAKRYSLHHELYATKTPGVGQPPADRILAALDHLLQRKQRAIFRADTRDEIHRALDIALEFELQTAIWGGREAWRTTKRLGKHKVDVIAEINFGSEPKITAPKASDKLVADVKSPLRVQEDVRARWKQRVAGLAALRAANIRIAISSRGLKNRGEMLKNLRLAIEAGLSRDDALAALTSDASAILGVEDRLGTLSVGKLAHVVVLTGPFDHEKSKLRHVFTGVTKANYNDDAKPVEVETKQKTEPPVETVANANSIAGQWKLSIDSADEKQTATLTLTRSGDKLAGTFSSKHGDGKVASGDIDGKQGFRFVVNIRAGSGTLALKFSGQLEQGRISGQLKSAFGAATNWSGERVVSANKANSNVVQFGSPVVAPIPNANANTKTKTVAKAKRPTELESDRLRRTIQTGGNVFIKNATVLTATAQTLPHTSILVKNGKIAAIGKKLKPEPGMKVIDATGRFVMPGIIDTHSHIMITSGVNESTLSIVPEVRIKDAVNSADTSEYRALAGGVTVARLLHGSANVIGGQDAVVKLRYGSTATEHILHDAPQGVKFALGENVKYKTTRFPNTRLGVEATLNRAFMEAIDYRRVQMEYKRQRAAASEKPNSLLPPRRDLRLEALADIVNHQKFIHSHCYRSDEILMLLRVTSDLGIRVWSLQHVLEGYKVAPEIVAHGASCSTFADWWAYKVEAFDAIPHNAALLKEAGANIVIKSDDRELVRHLYLEAAKTVRYGNMHPDHALQTITRNSARELGLDDRMGTIEVGKDADLAIFSGHPLNAFSRCEMTLIEGEVYFVREDVPSAMSAEAAKRSSTPPPLMFVSEKLRARPLDLAVAENGKYAIVGATLHLVDGDDVSVGTIVIEDGKIAAVGADVKPPADAKVIDGTGMHVSPGLIDAGTTLGLVEIARVKETHDYSEGGKFQPDLRAGVAINPDSELLPVARAGGITTVLMRPTGGVIAGQASLAKLAGWTAAEMIEEYEQGLQLNWRGDKKTVNELHAFLEEARLYLKLQAAAKMAKQLPPIADPRFDALRPYLEGEKPVFVEADSRKAIAEALLFAEKEKVKIIITGGTQAWLLADELKKRNVPVIVGPVMKRPLDSFDPFDAPYANPGRLHEAGVKFCIRSNNASNCRNAPFEAAMAVAFGLPPTEGLRAVTLSAAEILGIDDKVGSLTAGKRANVVLSDGPLLQHTSQIKVTFIDGKPYLPESRQTRFYERYRRRLHEYQQKNGK